ncbi:MAG: DUF2802 domain-containing protein [Pseudomonadota bacterium]
MNALNDTSVSLLSSVTPELLAAGLLVLASLCFFAGALVLLSSVRRERRTLTLASAAYAGPQASPALPADEAPTPQRRPRTNATRRRQGLAAPISEEAPGRDFSREISLAQQGSDAEELMAECGLTQLEAQLVVRLYGSDAKATSAAA